jgi:uncharacterized protein (DUF433 family)
MLVAPATDRSDDGAVNDGVTIDHRVMGGVPCITGTRIPVTTIVGLLGQGYSLDDVLADYPTLNRDSVLAALRFAADAVDERELAPTAIGVRFLVDECLTADDLEKGAFVVITDDRLRIRALPMR